MGIWALGMDGNAPDMLAALDGHAPPTKITAPGPSATAPSSVPTSTTSTTTPPARVARAGNAGQPSDVDHDHRAGRDHHLGADDDDERPRGPHNPRFSGTWKGQTVTLSAVSTLKSLLAGTATVIGQLTGFQTDDPTDACLASASSLNVWRFSNAPDEDVVLAAKPADCVTAAFTFPIPAGTTGTSGGSGSGTAGSGTSGTTAAGPGVTGATTSVTGAVLGSDRPSGAT